MSAGKVLLALGAVCEIIAAVGIAHFGPLGLEPFGLFLGLFGLAVG